MRQRCLNKNAAGYSYYGGRGISICEEWSSYDKFIEDMGYRPAAGYELYRIDANGQYCKENCRWVDKKTQQRNQRRTVFLTLNGVTKRRIEWAEELGIPESTIRKRLVRGKSIERALSPLNFKIPENRKICP